MTKENNRNQRPGSGTQTGRRGGFRGGPGPRGLMPGDKAKDFKGSMKKLVSYLSAYRLQIVSVMILALLSAVFSIAGPKILAQATNELFNGIMNLISGSAEGINFARIARILFFLLALYLVSAFFAYMQGFIMTDVSTKVSHDLRNSIAAKINRLPLKYFDTTTHGDVLSRVTNDVDVLNHSLNQSITQIISSVTTMIGVLIMMITISWSMTLVALGILPLSVTLVTFIVKKSQKYFRAQQEYLGLLNGHVEEMYGGHIVVKAFSREKESTEKFEEYNSELYRSGWKSQFISGLMMPMMHFVTNLGYVIICILGAYLTTRGSMTVGGIQAFIQYVRSFTHPVSQIANITNVIQQTAAASERIFEFLGEEEKSPEQAKVRVNRDGILKEGEIIAEGNVEFSHVHFGYDPDNIVIKDFSAVIRSGQKVALVGPTGAGKTTIVKLLMRFYDVNEGSIRIEGHDIREFSRDDLRSLFGMVLQDTWLYNDTIMENIRYGRLDASDEEVIAAARAAQADHFIRTLPESYQMVLNEEATNVSQGQKQLLTIARAILSDPKILILDEATSSVDTRTEILIQRAMDHLMEGRTSFVIAHRLSTIRNADLILCVDNGNIVEQGTHEELLQRGGFYANLYYSQFEKISAV
ncbi:MAG TPA: ABC transporter ATP-binding protein [Clostridiales bacterium]|jgi:ATP-binding cassette subfamily B multidrug efflux pump|nr:ABC transporter ATP-binding protein [Clostridiales bacterium]